MTLGYARPLQVTDLWKLQEHRSSEVIGNAILDSFEARRRKADEYNTRLANGEIKPCASCQRCGEMVRNGSSGGWKRMGRSSPALRSLSMTASNGGSGQVVY